MFDSVGLMVLATTCAVLLLVIVILLATQVELFRDVRQLRELTGTIDRPMAIDLGDLMGTEVSRIAPELPREGIALVLSDRCGTCRNIAAALDGAVPAMVYPVLTSPGGRKSELAVVSNLGDRVIEDVGMNLMERLGITVTPAAVVISNGRFQKAETVPSVRQLFGLIENTQSNKFVADRRRGRRHEYESR